MFRCNNAESNILCKISITSQEQCLHKLLVSWFWIKLGLLNIAWSTYEWKCGNKHLQIVDQERSKYVKDDATSNELDLQLNIMSDLYSTYFRSNAQLRFTSMYKVILRVLDHLLQWLIAFLIKKKLSIGETNHTISGSLAHSLR